MRRLGTTRMDAHSFRPVLLPRADALSSGGVFDFDAVSTDKTIIASISTSGARTASGKHAVGKLMKLRSDMLFLLLSSASRKLLILCEPDMHALCQRELDGGRVPKEIEFFRAPCQMNSRSGLPQQERLEVMRFRQSKRLCKQHRRNS